MSAAPERSSPSKSSSWPRFSLRVLLVMLTLAAGGFAWFGQWNAAKHREERARQWILNHGGSVGQFNGWEIERRAWWVRGLSLVVPRDCLYTVQSVYFEKADDSMLSCIVDLPHLQTLDLRESRVTDEGFVHLRFLRDLRTLNLANLRVSDEGFRHLAKNRRIEYLWLGDTQLTAASLPIVLQNRGLTHLSLDGWPISDAEVGKLVELPELEVLALRETKITSRAAALFRQLPKLKHLYLMRTAVDDAAVPELMRLRLQSLDVRFTKISADGQQALKKHVQYCEIDYGG